MSSSCFPMDWEKVDPAVFVSWGWNRCPLKGGLFDLTPSHQGAHTLARSVSIWKLKDIHHISVRDVFFHIMGDFDEDTAFLGQTGPYFWTKFFLLNTVFVSTGFNGLYIVFVGAAPKHHCHIPDVNLTEAWKIAIIPVKLANGEEIQSQCSRYKLDVVRNLSADGYIPGKEVNLTSLIQEPCLDGWTYSKDIYQSNIVTEVSLFTLFLTLLIIFTYNCALNY